MQFNNTTNKNGIVQMVENTTGLGLTAISGDAGQLAYFTELINQWLKIGHFYAWSIDKNWHFDDSNHTDFPEATTTLVDNQRDYTMPSGLLKLREVMVMDSGGKYYPLTCISDSDFRLKYEREQEDAGIPTHYYAVGTSLKLWPKPDTSQITASAGLKIVYDREMDLFTTSDTTQEPGLAGLLHPICYYGPSWEWAMTHNVPGVAQMCDRMLGNFPGIREIAEKHFSFRDKNDVLKITRKEVNYE